MNPIDPQFRRLIIYKLFNFFIALNLRNKRIFHILDIINKKKFRIGYKIQEHYNNIIYLKFLLISAKINDNFGEYIEHCKTPTVPQPIVRTCNT